MNNEYEFFGAVNVPKSVTHGIPLLGHFDSCSKEPSRRTKTSCPYSYDPIAHYIVEKPCTGGVYDDRMQQWDYDKFAKAAEMATGGSRMYFQSPKMVQKFIDVYYEQAGRSVVLIIEYCNVSNGYPCFYIGWNDKDSE